MVKSIPHLPGTQGRELRKWDKGGNSQRMSDPHAKLGCLNSIQEAMKSKINFALPEHDFGGHVRTSDTVKGNLLRRCSSEPRDSI